MNPRTITAFFEQESHRLPPIVRRNLKHESARMKDLTRIGDLRISRGRA